MHFHHVKLKQLNTSLEVTLHEVVAAGTGVREACCDHFSQWTHQAMPAWIDAPQKSPYSS